MKPAERSVISVVACRLRSRAVVELENLALRHQLHVLRRQRPGRLRLFTFDRLLWVLLYRLWPRCLEVMVLVKPATVVQWHRQGFRLFWRWRSRSGRPSVDREIRESDSADERLQSALGCTSDPWRAAQVRHRGQPGYRRQVHGAKARCAFPNLA
jgi:hypothetical protein